MIIRSWLPLRTTHDPEAVERIFCVPFKNLRVEITQHAVDAQNVIESTGMATKTTPFQTWVMDEMAKRMDEFMCVTLREETFLYLALVVDSVMTAKMYLTFIQYWCCNNQMNDVTYDLVKDSVFNVGFPSQSQLMDLWGKQKVNGSHSENLLDYRAAMRSILF